MLTRSISSSRKMIWTRKENFPQGVKLLLVQNKETLGIVAIDNSTVEI